MFLKVKKVIVVGAAVVLIVAVFAWGVLENTYVSYPRYPDPQNGRIVPHAVKGIIVYITESQRDLLSWLERNPVRLCRGLGVRPGHTRRP